MGHQLTALIARGSGSTEAAAKFDLPIVPLPQDFCLVPLTPERVDECSKRLQEFGSEPGSIALNCAAVHKVAQEIFGDGRFAIIETDYFGGVGSQAAYVYEDGQQIFHESSPQVGPINRALKLLGASRRDRRDHFDSLNLGRFRHTHDLLDSPSSSSAELRLTSGRAYRIVPIRKNLLRNYYVLALPRKHEEPTASETEELLALALEKARELAGRLVGDQEAFSILYSGHSARREKGWHLHIVILGSRWRKAWLYFVLASKNVVQALGLRRDDATRAARAPE